MNKPSIFNPCFSIRRLLAVSVLFLIGLQALAQQTVVKGVITDDSGQPVIGAAVVEKGTHNGNITDVDGKYSLTASSPNVTLEISCLGMISTEVAIQGRNTVNVTLQQESTALDGVVVTALGVKRDEKALGYAVSAVGAEELTAGREENVMSAIIGKVAGVDITTTTAGPTGSTRVSSSEETPSSAVQTSRSMSSTASLWTTPPSVPNPENGEATTTATYCRQSIRATSRASPCSRVLRHRRSMDHRHQTAW